MRKSGAWDVVRPYAFSGCPAFANARKRLQATASVCKRLPASASVHEAFAVLRPGLEASSFLSSFLELDISVACHKSLEPDSLVALQEVSKSQA